MDSVLHILSKVNKPCTFWHDKVFFHKPSILFQNKEPVQPNEWTIPASVKNLIYIEYTSYQFYMSMILVNHYGMDVLS